MHKHWKGSAGHDNSSAKSDLLTDRTGNLLSIRHSTYNQTQCDHSPHCQSAPATDHPPVRSEVLLDHASSQWNSDASEIQWQEGSHWSHTYSVSIHPFFHNPDKAWHPHHPYEDRPHGKPPARNRHWKSGNPLP